MIWEGIKMMEDGWNYVWALVDSFPGYISLLIKIVFVVLWLMLFMWIYIRIFTFRSPMAS
jgi:hypothetical protein